MNRFQLRPRHWIALSLGIVAAFALSALLMQGEVTSRLRFNNEPPVLITTGTIQNGDVLAVALTKRGGLDQRYVAKIEQALNRVYNLRTIQPGHTFEIVTSTDGIFQKFTYHISAIESYVIHRSSDDVYSTEKTEQQTVWMEKRVSGNVTENIYRDLLKQGYDDAFVANLVADLADNIFAWRIDFFTEQRPGDTFDILLEQEYLLGSEKPLWNGRGRILAATYNGKATKVKDNVAIRFQAKSENRPDYYDADGGAVRRAFLRAPFTHGAFRISSRFNPHRFHPILRTYRPHHGTDYAASKGTPVAAIGKGVVVRAERYKGYGNCIDIRHNSKYISRYGHLSKIAVKRGDSVQQGQYIGRVGSTGLSTGPHLHFEMLVDGTQRNFLTMSFPAASSVSQANMPEFTRVRDEMLARLNARPPESPQQVSMNLSR